MGHVRDVESWMARASLVVQPSRFEGCPNAVLESMGCGRRSSARIARRGPGSHRGWLQRPPGASRRRRGARARDGRADGDTVLRLQLGREATRVRERFRQDTIMAQWKAVQVPSRAKPPDSMPGRDSLSATTRCASSSCSTIAALRTRILAADMLGVADLRDRRFLDMGCGSGLFNLAARRLGARMRSFDFEAPIGRLGPELKRRYSSEDAA